MTTPDDKTLDMIVFNARQVAVAMSGEYAELAASADDYRTMADVIAALRAERDALLRVVAAADAMRRYDSYRMPGEPHWQYDVARAALKASN